MHYGLIPLHGNDIVNIGYAWSLVQIWSNIPLRFHLPKWGEGKGNSRTGNRTYIHTDLIGLLKVFFTPMSWLSNEPANFGPLLSATNYWTYVLMRGWIQIFVTRLFGDLFRLFQSCPCDYQTNGERVRATGILGILTETLSYNAIKSSLLSFNT